MVVGITFEDRLVGRQVRQPAAQLHGHRAHDDTVYRGNMRSYCVGGFFLKCDQTVSFEWRIHRVRPILLAGRAIAQLHNDLDG